MKKIMFASLAVFMFTNLFAQKKAATEPVKKEAVPEQIKYSCDSIVVDFETGLINGKINSNSPLDSIKKYLPCITLEIPAGSEDHICGSGSMLEKQGIFFNREHGCIEFSATTLAHFSQHVMGVAEDDLSAITGDPTQISDLQPYTDRAVQSVYLYPKSYGCLAVWVDQKDKKVVKVQLHNTSPANAYLCVE